METEKTSIPDVQIIHNPVYRDHRGFFQELYRRNEQFGEAIGEEFVQDNFSFSEQNVLRGLHYQLRNPQGKLVQALSGEIYDVAVDIREGSPTFGEWVGERLTGDSGKQLWIPAGFAHGFCVCSESARVFYKCTAFYDPEDDRGIIWNDPELNVDWPVSDPVVSEKDGQLPDLSEAELPTYQGDE